MSHRLDVNKFLQKNNNTQRVRGEMMPFMAERQVIRIAITTAAKASVEKACAELGMSQQELTSRVFEWFAEQDRSVQLAALKLLPEELEAAAADIYMEQVKARRAEHRAPRGSGKKGPR